MEAKKEAQKEATLHHESRFEHENTHIVTQSDQPRIRQASDSNMTL